MGPAQSLAPSPYIERDFVARARYPLVVHFMVYRLLRRRARYLEALEER